MSFLASPNHDESFGWDKPLLSMSTQNYDMGLSANVDGNVAWIYHLRLRLLAQTISNT